MISQYMKKFLYSVSAFLMLGLGISLQIKAGIGQSMLNAFALILAELFNLEIGTTLNLLNMLFFVLYLVIRKSHINRRDIVQVAATIAKTKGKKDLLLTKPVNPSLSRASTMKSGSSFFVDLLG